MDFGICLFNTQSVALMHEKKDKGTASHLVCSHLNAHIKESVKVTSSYEFGFVDLLFFIIAFLFT